MTGFLEGHQANGAFVAVGPPGKYYLRDFREIASFLSVDRLKLGFTALALLRLGEYARTMCVSLVCAVVTLAQRVKQLASPWSRD